MFYHNTLSLMTAKATVTWMKEKGIYKRWLLPLGINKGTVFENRVIGNLPEMMPMDVSLNKDVDDAVSFHVSLTYNLSNEDPKFFRCPPQSEEPVHTFGYGRQYHRLVELLKTQTSFCMPSR